MTGLQLYRSEPYRLENAQINSVFKKLRFLADSRIKI